MILTAYARSSGKSPKALKESWRRFTAKASKTRAEAMLRQFCADTFASRLRAWRGSRLQKEAAYILGVPLKTYVNWEQMRNTPGRSAMEHLSGRMEENPDKKHERL
jgi:DNA-binding transcriptional regulator YiaG